ncbi:MAG: fused acetyl/propionyl-CoA carboxylase subunit alpha/methylmalonyl-CoA decarboxylase subunit alpha, partial [Microlunatus sp.]|nr:fused acetyl/propionyl-CoA carboxylase subunit alpha/methylmalonyl-CoA decarboxylase subunit alpha [Microlunatus sp.]
DGPSVDLDLPDADTASQRLAERAEQQRRDLFAVLIGYDLDPHGNGRTLATYLDGRDQLLTERESPVPGELALLEAFADVAELSRNRPAGEDLRLENQVHTPREHFHTFLQSFDPERGALPEDFRVKLSRVLRHYGVTELTRTPELEQAVFRIFLAQQRWDPDIQLVTALLQRWIDEPTPGPVAEQAVRDVLDRLVTATQRRFPVVGELARSVRFRWYDQPLVDAERRNVLDAVDEELVTLTGMPAGPERTAGIDKLAGIPERIARFLAERITEGELPADEPMLAVLIKRHYREYALRDLRELSVAGRPFAVADYTTDRQPTHLVSTIGRFDELRPGSSLVDALTAQTAAAPAGHRSVVDLYLAWPEVPESADQASAALGDRLTGLGLIPAGGRLTTAICSAGARRVGYFVFRPAAATDQPDEHLVEDPLVRGVHPMVARRLTLGRLRNFEVTRLEAPDDVLLYRCVAPGNEADQRLVALCQVRQLAVIRDADGRVVALPHAERAISKCREAIRRVRAAAGAAGTRLDTNYVWVYIWPTIDADPQELTALQTQIAPLTTGAGIEELLVGGTLVMPDGSEQTLVAGFRYQPGTGVVTSLGAPPLHRLEPLDDYSQKVVRARRRGVVYPYELQAMIAGPGGTATEYDLDADGVLVPVMRPYGLNQAGIIAGVISSPTERHPEPITRVLLCGDPLRSLGAVAEPECTRIIAALDLAESMRVPVEWFALSAGARISMDSGTENMDWVARALKRIVEFTQSGGEINVVVAGINVGAQPYWNAEATMLMHTRGVLIMTPDSAMVLTGKQSLDFSGGVSAEDNYGIGGYDRVMGPNGQAQYWAPDLAGARAILMAHYDHTWVVPGESGPRRVSTSDPHDRDVTTFPHNPAGSGFTTVGDIFSPATNPDRKKAFDIRTVMAAITDQDHRTLERWSGMADAETSVVWDAHLGGLPVCVIGIESKSVPRLGFPPTDGPDVYTAGTLFPRSSKKTARAINSASGNRPVVVIANLSGFDGSPESMRKLQLEYGAEIGRAIVNFEGPIVFCVVSRYHGGAFVVFSKALNPQMTVLAIEGSYASVIGGAPAAAVVFARDVDARTARDPRVVELEGRLAGVSGAERAGLATELADLRRDVRAEKLGEVATEFDRVHNIHRAVEVGSVNEVIAGSQLRPKIIAALEHGLGLS